MIFLYGSILFFVTVTFVRVRRCIYTPIHLQWDLYQESSVYEARDWWTKPPRSFGEKVRAMVLEIIFLREFYHRNRHFWYPLFVFHAGLYLLIFWHLWLFIEAVVASSETASSFGWVWGTCATALTFIGGTMILWMRVTDRELKVYYPPIHYVKWVFLLLTLLGGVYPVDLHFRLKGSYLWQDETEADSRYLSGCPQS